MLPESASTSGVPILPLLLLTALLTLLFARGFRHGVRLMAIISICLFLWAWPPFAALLSGTLEWWYPAGRLPQGEPQAIVILGAGVYPHDASQPEDLPNQGTFLRSSYGAWLYRNWRPLPIVVSGGSSDTKDVPPSAIMGRILEQSGVPSPAIWRESRSRTTYENALYSAALLRARGINRVVLVTEAYHMLRAEAAFRRQGLAVIPTPCCYRTLQFHGRWADFMPQPSAVQHNEDCLHEWLGLVWYFVSRRI